MTLCPVRGSSASHDAYIVHLLLVSQPSWVSGVVNSYLF